MAAECDDVYLLTPTSELPYRGRSTGAEQPPGDAVDWSERTTGVRSRITPHAKDTMAGDDVAVLWRADGCSLVLHRPKAAGGRPLYYAVLDAQLVLTDSLRPFWCKGGVGVDPHWIVEVVYWGYPVSHRTPYLGVQQVLADEWIEIDFAAAGVREVVYWSACNDAEAKGDAMEGSSYSANGPFTDIPKFAQRTGTPSFCNQQLHLARTVDFSGDSVLELPTQSLGACPRPGLRTHGLLKRRWMPRRVIRRYIRKTNRELETAWHLNTSSHTWHQWLHAWRAVPSIQASLHAYAGATGRRVVFTGNQLDSIDGKPDSGSWAITDTPYRNIFEYYQSLHYDRVDGMIHRWLKCDPWNTSRLVRAWRDGKDHADACEGLCLLALSLDYLARFSNIRCEYSLANSNPK